MKEQSYIVVEHFVDLNGIMRGVCHSYSESDTLIKYSKKEHSPVSSGPSNSIRLGAYNSYGDYINDPGLVGDASEGKYTEAHDWTKRGNRWTEARRKRLIGNSPVLQDINLRNIKLKMSITWALHGGSWLYCTSIDPKLKGQRIVQMRKTDPQYNFMTKIDEPTTFAQQLGHDFGNQIESNRGLKCDSPGWHTLASAVSRQYGIGNYSIFVHHGPVIYLGEKESAEFINCASEKIDNIGNLFVKGKAAEFIDSVSKKIGNIVVLFVKDKKYQEQQEYRFVVDVNFHGPSENEIFLKVSDGLKTFMSPLFL